MQDSPGVENIAGMDLKWKNISAKTWMELAWT